MLLGFDNPALRIERKIDAVFELVAVCCGICLLWFLIVVKLSEFGNLAVERAAFFLLRFRN